MALSNVMWVTIPKLWAKAEATRLKSKSVLRVLILGSVAFCLVVILGCVDVVSGSSNSIAAVPPNGSGHGPCALSNEKGEALRIEPQTSGLTCGEIQEVMVLLPSATGVWPLYSNGKVGEVCRIFGTESPVRVTCHKAGRSGQHFEIVDVGRKRKVQMGSR
jgi:hypothetical protein